MKLQETELKGAWLAQSQVHVDDRGSFREWFKYDEVKNTTGLDFIVRQSNISISQKNTIRGMHFSISPIGQSKWITCVAGSIWDVIVDIRPGSPTFRKWAGIELSENSGLSLLAGRGFAHGFLALEDHSAISYLLTSEYSPSEEFGFNPLDSNLSIDWKVENPILSQKDSNAPTLNELYTSRNLLSCL
jgi:dTDP-4-dehydrorhamnose 3,5-epimerase